MTCDPCNGMGFYHDINGIHAICNKCQGNGRVDLACVAEVGPDLLGRDDM